MKPAAVARAVWRLARAVRQDISQLTADEVKMTPLVHFLQRDDVGAQLPNGRRYERQPFVAVRRVGENLQAAQPKPQKTRIPRE